MQITQEEVAKLTLITDLGLPDDLFTGIPAKLLADYRQQVAVEELHELRRHPDARRRTVLATFYWVRRQEIIDTLAEILMDVIQCLGTCTGRKEDNDIFSNGYRGISITTGGNPTLRHNRINKNIAWAIRVTEDGSGMFEDNDLRDNQHGAWRIADNSKANIKRAQHRGITRTGAVAGRPSSVHRSYSAAYSR